MTQLILLVSLLINSSGLAFAQSTPVGQPSYAGKEADGTFEVISVKPVTTNCENEGPDGEAGRIELPVCKLELNFLKGTTNTEKGWLKKNLPAVYAHTDGCSFKPKQKIHVRIGEMSPGVMCEHPQCTYDKGTAKLVPQAITEHLGSCYGQTTWTIIKPKPDPSK